MYSTRHSEYGGGGGCNVNQYVMCERPTRAAAATAARRAAGQRKQASTANATPGLADRDPSGLFIYLLTLKVSARAECPQIISKVARAAHADIGI